MCICVGRVVCPGRWLFGASANVVHRRQDCSQNFRGPPQWTLQPSPFSDRCGPYQTPQTQALLSMAIFSTGVWVLGIFFFRQTLKLLLSYHGWMFEMHGQTSYFTKVWAVSRS